MPPLLLLLCLAHPANPLPLLGLDTGNPAADREASMWLVRACYLLLCRRGAVLLHHSAEKVLCLRIHVFFFSSSFSKYQQGKGDLRMV